MSRNPIVAKTFIPMIIWQCIFLCKIRSFQIGYLLCKFFSSQHALDRFTSSLKSAMTSQDACSCCTRNDQWVSHGYTYKIKKDGTKTICGKRIICSNRYGNSGCGHTRQLYLEHVIPGRQYSVCTAIAFIKALFSGTLIDDAYIQATGSITSG